MQSKNHNPSPSVEESTSYKTQLQSVPVEDISATSAVILQSEGMYFTALLVQITTSAKNVTTTWDIDTR